MVCFHPLKGYRSFKVNPDTGKRPIVFSASQGYSDLPVVVPCGKCLGCLMTRAFYWSVRCFCESTEYEECYFLTLTYDKEHLPEDRNLNRAHFQGFMKRLRYYFKDYKLRVFYCGEYGDKRHRPHYHAIIFGLPLERENIYFFPVDVSKRGNVNYACPFLDKIWSLGMVRLGNATSGSMRYVAQYTLGKVSQKQAAFLSTRQVQPFIGASNRPGIGFNFFMKHHTEMYRRGFFRPFPDSDTIVRHVPYFDRLLEKHFKIEWFTYLELPKRRNWSRKAREYRKRGFCDSLFNPLIDRDVKELYYKERKLERNLQSRDDF